MSKPQISTSPTSRDIAIGAGILIAFVLTLMVIAALLANTDNTYRKGDCIRQWHDVGIYARAEEYCADYP